MAHHNISCRAHYNSAVAPTHRQEEQGANDWDLHEQQHWRQEGKHCHLIAPGSRGAISVCHCAGR